MSVYNSLPNYGKGQPAIAYIWDESLSYFRPVNQKEVPSSVYDFSGVFGAYSGASYEIDNDFGYSSIGFHLNIPSGGKVAFEGTFDDVNWNSLTLRQLGTDGYVTHENESNGYIGSVSTMKKIRIRTYSAGSTTGSVVGRLSNQVNTIEGIEHGFAPHRIGFQIVHKDFEFDGPISGQSVWIPESGKKFVVTDINYSIVGGNTVLVTFYEDVNAAGKRISRLKVVPQNNAGSIISENFSSPYVSSLSNTSVKLDVSGAGNIVGVMHGYEITNGLT